MSEINPLAVNEDGLTDDAIYSLYLREPRCVENKYPDWLKRMRLNFHDNSFKVDKDILKTYENLASITAGLTATDLMLRVLQHQFKTTISRATSMNRVIQALQRFEDKNPHPTKEKEAS